MTHLKESRDIEEMVLVLPHLDAPLRLAARMIWRLRWHPRDAS
ncbi:MAG TPA: hypothetical protein VGL18_02035 [Actinomycetota bacterium]